MALFTRENARQMTEKGLAVRRANREARRTLAQRVQALTDKVTELTALPSPDFASTRLGQVRNHLTILDSLIREEKDPERLDLLTRSQLRLSQQEFALAGRPMPGQLRPTQAQARRVTIDVNASPFGPAPAALPGLPPAPTPKPVNPGKLVIGPGSFKRAGN